MLTLVEDAIRGEGHVSPDTTGVYWRLVYGGSLSDQQLTCFSHRSSGEANSEAKVSFAAGFDATRKNHPRYRAGKEVVDASPGIVVAVETAQGRTSLSRTLRPALNLKDRRPL